MIRKINKGVYENMELGKELFEDILKKSATRYLSYKEDLGRLEIIMLSKIEVVEPGMVGLDEQEWNPPVEDRDGNPIIQQFGPNKGEVMEPWAKVEVECRVLSCSGDKSLVDGGKKFFRIGGINSGLLKTFIRAIKQSEIDLEEFVGTKWSIYGEKQNFWKYTVEYLGTGDVEEDTKEDGTKKEVVIPKSNIDADIVSALKAKKDQSKGGLQDIEKAIHYLEMIIERDYK